MDRNAVIDECLAEVKKFTGTKSVNDTQMEKIMANVMNHTASEIVIALTGLKTPERVNHITK